jgi:hypothetical protein
MIRQQKRVRTSRALVWFAEGGEAVVDRIITVDNSALSVHMPKTKQQSKQWLKGKVHVTRSKITVLVFFDSQGVNYYVLKSKAVNSACTVQVL